MVSYFQDVFFDAEEQKVLYCHWICSLTGAKSTLLYSCWHVAINKSRNMSLSSFASANELTQSLILFEIYFL